MRILLVDDEELQLVRLTDAVKKVLSAEHEFLTYINPVRAWEENKARPVDIAFLDIEMPVCSGIMLAKKLKSVNPQVNVIFVTAVYGADICPTVGHGLLHGIRVQSAVCVVGGKIQ